MQASKKSKKNQGAQRPKLSGVDVRAGMPKETINLSQCAKEYMDVLLDPCMSVPACLPLGFPFPSQKVKLILKGTGSTGTAGAGYVFFAPGRCIQNTGTCIYYTGATYAGTTWLTVGTGVTGVAMTTSPYNSASISALSAGLQYRLVSACVRVLYRGTEMNRGGDYVGLCTEFHQELESSTLASAANQPVAVRAPVKNEWFEITYNGPVYPAEVAFVGDISPATGPAYNGNIMGINFNSAANAQPFDWEVYVNFELIGQPALDVSTGAADPVGAGAVISGLKDVQKDGMQASHRSPAFIERGLASIGNALHKGLTWVGRASTPAALMIGAFKAAHLPRLTRSLTGYTMRQLPRIAAAAARVAPLALTAM